MTRRLDALIDRALDGTPIDWDDALGAAPDRRERKLVRQLRTIAFVARVYARSGEGDSDRALLLSRYRVIDELGQGGMGWVWRAFDETLRREVALKLLPDHLAPRPEYRARFLREARMAAALNHPNICTIHEVTETDRDVCLSVGTHETTIALGTPLIVMELVHGRTLRQLLDSEGPLPFDRLLDVTAQIADGVRVAHERSIIHRDLKPANVMVSAEDRVKILDFGLARPVDAAERRSEDPSRTNDGSGQVTRGGSILGTPSYMSPEQARGDRLDERSDIFAFGATLYELACGEPLFSTSSATSATRALEQRNRGVPFDSLQGIPAPLASIVGRCLELAPEDRYPSMHDVCEALRHVRGPTASSAHEHSPAHGRRRRVPWLVALVGSAILLAAGLLPARWHYTNRTADLQASGSREGARIAVLPFDNLGADDEAYLAAATSEEITTLLTQLRGLRVISRTSARRYDRTAKTTFEIGKALGADYLLEGSVLRKRGSANDERVRVTARLIRVADDDYVWSATYDRDLENGFAVQSEIARRVAQQIVPTLASSVSPPAEPPTRNMDAYRAYLRGVAIGEFDTGDAATARKMFEQAIDLDPKFALAHAALSRILSYTYGNGYGTAELGALAEFHAERAFELAPDLPDSHLARGYYLYWCRRDYERAFEELAVVEGSRPNDTDLLHALGAIERRRGNWDRALAYWTVACELTPRDPHLPYDVAQTLIWMRRFPEAKEYVDLLLAEFPEHEAGYELSGRLTLGWHGDIAAARAAYESGPGLPKTGYWGALRRSELDFYERDFASAARRFDGVEYSTERPVELNGLAVAGLAHRLAGRPKPAASSFRQLLQLANRTIDEGRDEAETRGLLAVACAGLDRRADARREAARTLASLEEVRDAVLRPRILYNLALVYALVGDDEAAVDQLARVLALPGPLSKVLVKMDPRWDSLHDRRRFRELVDPG